MRHIILLLTIIGMLGCGEKTEEKTAETILEKAIESKTGGETNVDIKGENVRIKTKDGEMKMSSGSSAKIPAEFPKDIFLYDADLNTSMELPEGYNLTFQTKDDASKISDAYLEEMTQKGWSKEMSMDMGNQKMLVFKKSGPDGKRNDCPK